MIRSLVDYTPIKRFDGIPWTSARIEESPDTTGPWTVIDTFVFDVPDPDPTNPSSRSFTTTHAALESGWLRVVFLDVGDNELPTTPVYYSENSAVPTVDEIRSWSKVEFADLGYAEASPDPLNIQLARAVQEFYGLTSIDPYSLSASGATAADRALVVLVQDALQKLVEYAAAAGQHEIIETAADFDMIQSMNADSYSETRRSMRAAYAIHPWPALSRLLGLIIELGGGGSPDVPTVGHPDYAWNVANYIINARRITVSKFTMESGTPIIFDDSIPGVG